MSNVRDGDWFSQRAAEVLARLLHGPPSELALQFFVLSIQRVPTWRLATHGNACPSFRMNLSLAPDGSIARGLVVDAELVDHVLPDVVAVAAGPWLLPCHHRGATPSTRRRPTPAALRLFVTTRGHARQRRRPSQRRLLALPRGLDGQALRQTETWLPLVARNGLPFQSADRDSSSRPAN